MMRLLFAIKSLNVEGGGAERVLVDVANGLRARGHEVVLLTFDSAGNSFYPLHQGIVRIDLGVGPPGQPTPRGRLFGSLPAMRREVLRVAPDLVVGFMHSMYIPLGLALLGTGIPVVASEHIGLDHFSGRPLQRLLVAITNPMFVSRTVPSAAIRDEFSDSRRHRVQVLPNPIDLSAFAGVEVSSSVQHRVVLTVGRFMAQKNHVELLIAFSVLAGEFPDWKLRIVGDGDLRSQIEAQIRELGLVDRVEVPGMVRDVASEYARSAIVAIPSTYESFGLVAAEAFACSRPVVGFSDCPGTNAIIQHEVNGLLVSREGNPAANFAKALERLIREPGLRERLGKAGPASVAQFELTGVVDHWERFLLQYAE
jgi:glycosyltransferase involved in cell wall biosynthesis